MPGVGPHSRFQVAAPGQAPLFGRSNGTLRVLIDGSKPLASIALNLIDVNAPDVSYDGKRIVFAGLPAGTYDLLPLNDPSAWRIYSINVDGTRISTKSPFSDRDNLDLSQFGDVASHFTSL